MTGNNTGINNAEPLTGDTNQQYLMSSAVNKVLSLIDAVTLSSTLYGCKLLGNALGYPVTLSCGEVIVLIN